MNNENRSNPREVALIILYEIDVKKSYSNISLRQNLNRYSLISQDRALVTQLVYGVIKNKSRLDWIISKYSNTPIKKISPWVHNILRLGIYQITFLDKIPISAAVNESVKLGKKFGHKKISGYINAILRNIARTDGKDLYPENENNIEYLSIVYSHPKWMVEKWAKDFGLDFTIELMKKNNEVPPITVRTNTLKISRAELMKLLQEEGMIVREGVWCPEAILIHNSSNIENSKSFQQGLFQVQDQSSMLVAHIMNPQKDELIIDLCAAPGGKTTHIAQLMKDKGLIIARDIHNHKLNLMRTSLNRLGITNVRLENYNALQFDKKYSNKADRVLLDAPCTGLGIIRRKPDLKWNKDIEDIKLITDLQLRMLENAASYLKRGGTLIYSTCTLNPEENLKIVEEFLNRNSNYNLVPFQPLSKEMGVHKEIDHGYLQLFPNRDDVDGFFISKIQREDSV